jgi:hypothetical protein
LAQSFGLTKQAAIVSNQLSDTLAKLMKMDHRGEPEPDIYTPIDISCAGDEKLVTFQSALYSMSDIQLLTSVGHHDPTSSPP